MLNSATDWPLPRKCHSTTVNLLDVLPLLFPLVTSHISRAKYKFARNEKNMMKESQNAFLLVLRALNGNERH